MFEIRLNRVRLDLPHLFEPNPHNDDKKYTARFIISKDHKQMDELHELIDECAAEKWPKKKPKDLKICIYDGEEKEDYDGYDDTVVYINASTKKRPTLIDGERARLEEDDEKLYAGAWVTVKLNLWAQDNSFGRRINAGLQGVQFYGHGESLAGGGSVASIDDFDVVDTDEEEDDDI